MASFRFIFAIVLSSSLVHAQCYYPNGQDAPRDTPCQPDAEASACCADGYICVSTGMCQFVDDAGTGKFARGSCTNQDWSSSLCPNYCTDADGEEAGGTDVTRCQGYTDRFFCPKSQNANVCKDESKALIFSSEPSVLTTILAASKTVQSTQSTETSEATTTSSSQETTSTPKDEETSTTASTSPNETGPADKDSASDKDSDSDSSPSPALLGGAIGGSIGGFLLGGLGVWLIFFLRRGKNQSQVVPEPENGYKDDHRPAPKAEMSAESAPAELPGYSVDDRTRQE